MENIKFGIIGLGNIGKRHLAVLDANKNVEVVQICDIDVEKCKAQAALYNYINYTVDYNELLSNSEIDMVCICTPHATHKPIAIDSSNAGKNVLVEKPMALSSVDCDLMIKAAKENGKRLFVVKQNRYNMPVMLVKEALESGKLGEIHMVNCSVLWNRNIEYYSESDWRGSKLKEGGALYTQASHFIDLLVWCFGEIVEAKTTLQNKIHDIDFEDCGSTVVSFANGAIGNIIWTNVVYSKNYEGSITLIGENGTIKIGGKYLNTIEYWDVKGYELRTDIVFEDKPNLYGKYQGTSSNHDKVMEKIVEEFSSGKNLVVDGEEGKKTVRAIEKIYQGQR
ncbi:MAG: Gfo/Idh/MocA family oxidoreductase [Flavobacteriales bacterium]|jgi:UDP-N-acetyl-2-amino-2-deoxyglucuronate dehydrogenase|nr:Gfo/Idh/MocA family oxidoreductase [Flavobacteriales bacterium]